MSDTDTNQPTQPDSRPDDAGAGSDDRPTDPNAAPDTEPLAPTHPTDAELAQRKQDRELETGEENPG